MNTYTGRCVCCDAIGTISDENPYCDDCQKDIRQVFDKDAYCLGQMSKGMGKDVDLDWTNYN